MDILENNIIGNFIYCLGHSMGQHGSQAKPEPISVNLLQQTPLDTSLGDVLLAKARVVRLIEFKREANKDRKERAKYLLLVKALSAPGMGYLQGISRKVHWFVLTNYDRPDRTSIVVPYIEMTWLSGSRGLDQFIREITADMAGPGMTDDELRGAKRYLEILGQYAGSPQGAKGGAVGGLLLTINAKGETKYIVIENVRELAMEPQAVIARHMERQCIIEKQVRQEQEREQMALRQAESYGPSLGM